MGKRILVSLAVGTLPLVTYGLYQLGVSETWLALSLGGFAAGLWTYACPAWEM